MYIGLFVLNFNSKNVIWYIATVFTLMILNAILIRVVTGEGGAVSFMIQVCDVAYNFGSM